MKKIRIGDKASKIFKVTENQISLFAHASGDLNPLHLDEEYAKKTIFGQRIAHGMLTASYISCILGTILPGEGSIYLKQSIDFKKPVYIDDIIEAIVVVTDINKGNVTLSTICMNQEEEIVISGEALVKVTKENLYDL